MLENLTLPNMYNCTPTHSLTYGDYWGVLCMFRLSTSLQRASMEKPRKVYLEQDQ